MDEFTLDSDAEIAQEHDYDSNNKKDTHLNNKFSFDDGEVLFLPHTDT